MYQKFPWFMASSPEDSIPPLRGFDSEGESVSVTVDELLTDPKEEEFRTPAASELAGEYRLKSRTVKPSTRARARRNTISADCQVEPFPNRGRVRAALDRIRRLEYAGGDTTSQDSQESLLWDSAAQNLEDPFDHMRLWSSSAMSSHFDVTVVKSESLSEDMATAGLQISEEDLRDAGPSGLLCELFFSMRFFLCIQFFILSTTDPPFKLLRYLIYDYRLTADPITP